MGGRQSEQQSYIYNSSCHCGSHDEKRPCNYMASDYGSWTKLSLTNQTPPPTRIDAVVSDSDSEHSERNMVMQGDVKPVSPSTLLLTRPPSVAQDCLIRGVAPKLLDVGPDVISLQKRYLSTSCVSSPTNSTPEALTPGKADALHYSLCMTPELSPSEAKSRKKIISNSFSHHMETLMEQIKPDEVADRLYGIGVLDIDELGRASDKQEAVDDRARELVRLLKRKLWQSPEWFVDVCKILRNCGVKVIAQVIDDVYSECPTEEMSILSTGRSFSGSTSTVKSSIRKSSLPSYHDMIRRIEYSFKEGGLQAATERVQKYTAEQGGDLQLVHKACQCGIEVSTLDLLLDILDQVGDNHITNSKDEYGRTPLHEACAGLKPRSADIEEKDALESNAEQRLKIDHLMTRGANYCAKDKDGNTALHLAVLRSDCEAASVLLRSGKRCINIVNKRGNTALHLASRRGQVDIVKALCYHKANTSTQNNKTLTALHVACIHNHIDAAIELASHDKSTLDAFDKYHRTPLHICCKKGNTLLALALLRLKNCSTFKMDKDSKTPLHYAVSGGNLSLVTALLQKDGKVTGGETKGLMVDAQDRYGDTALHIAGRHGNKPIAKQLLNYRANKDILNQEGKNPLEVAIECEHDMVAAKLIRKRGWHQHRKTMRRVYKLRRTLTQSTLLSTTFQSEASDNVEDMSSESEDDENVGSGERKSSVSAGTQRMGMDLP